MASWPKTWIARTLDGAGIPATTETIAILKAWKESTPLPPLTNNPIGLPKGMGGSASYMGTGYAIFPSIQSFSDAFAGWASSYQGKMFIHAATSDNPYAATWRIVSKLGWPGSATETDYPAAILDLTEQAYRDSVSTSPRAQRKTSGVVGEGAASKSEVMAHARSLANMWQTMQHSNSALNAVIRKHS